MPSKKKTVKPIIEDVIAVVPAVTVAPTVMPELPTKTETPGIKSFFGNYWQFVVWAAVFIALAYSKSVFDKTGSLLYLPLKGFSVFLLAFIFRHILNKTSTAAYIKDGAYDTDFASLPAVTKCLITQGQFAVYIIVIAILAASIL